MRHLRRYRWFRFGQQSCWLDLQTATATDRRRTFALMKESPFGFEYSWADLKPVRVLVVTVVVAQLSGAAFGFAFQRFPDWFESAWHGAALATFPAFLVGLLAQARLRPGSIGSNAVMVRRLGLVALLLTAFAVAMPWLKFAQ